MKTILLLLLLSVCALTAGLTLGSGGSGAAYLPPESVSGSANLKASPPPKPAPEKPVLAPRPPKPPRPSPLVEAMEADRLCEAVSLLSRSGAHTKDTAPALLASLGASPALRELFSPEGPLFGEAAPTHRLGKLFLALRLGGLLHTASGAQDLSRARALLLELEKEDPSNGALPLFRLDVEQKQGLKKENLRDTARQAASASHFDTYLSEELKDLEASRWQTPTHHLVVTSFLESAYGINFYHAMTTIQDVDREFHERFSAHLGELMMQKGRRAARSHYFHEYHPSEYDWGREIADPQAPGSYQLSLEREGKASWPYAPYLSPTGCERETYDQHYDLMRSLL